MLILMIAIFTSCNKKKDTVNNKDVDITTGENKEDLQKETEEDIKDNESIDIKDEDVVNEVDNHEGEAINPLTGLWIEEEKVKTRPISIMIENQKKATPQSGLSKADIIYEAPAEGGITRFLAVYQDFDIDKIGPVRSARRYYLDFAFDHDAIYVHYGQDPMLVKQFDVLKSPHLNGLSGLDEIMCWRSSDRAKPHNVYTNEERLLKAWDVTGYRKEKNNEFPNMFLFNEEDTVSDGENIKHMAIPYLIYKNYNQISEFYYDEESTLYKRVQFDEPHIDELTNEQLTTKNIIVQIADIKLRKGDTEGRLDIKTIDKGNGYYLSNGKKVDIQWEKKSQYEPTKWYEKNGNELKLNKGNTWICLVSKTQEIIFE